MKEQKTYLKVSPDERIPKPDTVVIGLVWESPHHKESPHSYTTDGKGNWFSYPGDIHTQAPEYWLEEVCFHAVKDGLSTAKEIAIKHGLYHSHTRLADEKAVAAMQEYSDQQNAELRERVKELEVAISKISTITVGDIAFKLAKEALKQGKQ